MSLTWNDNWITPLGTAVDLAVLLAIIGLITGGVEVLVILVVAIGFIGLIAMIWGVKIGVRS